MSNCLAYNLPGIEKIYLAEVTGDTLNYCLSGNSLFISDYITFNQLPIIDDNNTFNEKKVVDAKGLYYTQNFELSIPDYHTTTPHDLLNKGYAVIFKDYEGWWIAGFEQPLAIDKIESKNDKDNVTNFNLSVNSYQRVKPILELWDDHDSYLAFPIGSTTGYTGTTYTGYTFSIDDNLFNMYSATGITFAFWYTLSTGASGSYQSIFERFLSYDSTTLTDDTVFFNSSGSLSPSSTSSLTPGHKYLIVLRAHGTTSEIWLKSATDAGSSDSVGGWSGLPNSPDQLFKLHTQNDIKSFGVWNRYLSGTEIDTLFFFHGDRSEVTYADLTTGLKNGLIAYYDNDAAIDSHTSIIEDKHTNNLDLTRES